MLLFLYSFTMKHYVTLLEEVRDRQNRITLGKGAILILNLASAPMVKAIRKKYLDNPQSMLITKRGKKFLFEFDGFSMD